jgi:hypothetical protein
MSNVKTNYSFLKALLQEETKIKMRGKNQKLRKNTGTMADLLPPLLTGLSLTKYNQGRTIPPEAQYP